MAEKLDRAQQVLERTPLGALPDEVAERRPFFLAQRPFELEIEIDPVLFAEDMREEVLRIQARAFNALFAKVVRRRRQNFKDRHLLVNCIAGRECATDMQPARARKTEALHQASPCAGRESRYRRGMFELTRREKGLIAGFVLIFLLGFGVRQWRDSAAFDSRPAQVH